MMMSSQSTSVSALSQTAAELCAADAARPRLQCPPFDALCGGLPVQGITEIAGESSAGKTQLCMTMAIKATFPVELGGLGGDVLYINTEDKFPMGRLESLAVAMCGATLGAPPPSAVMSRIHFRNVDDVAALQLAVNQLPSAVAKHRVKLVIVDSLAAPLRAADTPTSAAAAKRGGSKEQVNAQDKSKLIFMIGSQLKALNTGCVPRVATASQSSSSGAASAAVAPPDTQPPCIVVVNQVSDVVLRDGTESEWMARASAMLPVYTGVTVSSGGSAGGAGAGAGAAPGVQSLTPAASTRADSPGPTGTSLPSTTSLVSISTSFTPVYVLQHKVAAYSNGRFLHPSLGLSWDSCVTTRFLMTHPRGGAGTGTSVGGGATVTITTVKPTGSTGTGSSTAGGHSSAGTTVTATVRHMYLLRSPAAAPAAIAYAVTQEGLVTAGPPLELPCC